MESTFYIKLLFEGMMESNELTKKQRGRKRARPTTGTDKRQRRNEENLVRNTRAPEVNKRESRLPVQKRTRLVKEVVLRLIPGSGGEIKTGKFLVAQL